MALVAGLAAAAVVAGSAAAARPMFLLNVHARLAPVAGTKAAGSFDGELVLSSGSKTSGTASLPRAAVPWRLSWRLSLPALKGAMTASLHLRAANGAAPATRTLCTHCGTAVSGTMTLTGTQALRITQADSFVVVSTRSATLRGPIKVFVRVPVQSAR